jgi:hypothetical protein
MINLLAIAYWLLAIRTSLRRVRWLALGGFRSVFLSLKIISAAAALFDFVALLSHK